MTFVSRPLTQALKARAPPTPEPSHSTTRGLCRTGDPHMRLPTFLRVTAVHLSTTAARRLSIEGLQCRRQRRSSRRSSPHCSPDHWSYGVRRSRIRKGRCDGYDYQPMLRDKPPVATYHPSPCPCARVDSWPCLHRNLDVVWFMHPAKAVFERRRRCALNGPVLNHRAACSLV